MAVTLNHYLVLSGVIFAIGLYGVLARRNVVAILMSIELMFNAVNISLIAFARYLPASAAGPLAPLTGQVFTLFIITVAAAEAAVALALLVAIYRTRRTVDVEEVSVLRS